MPLLPLLHAGLLAGTVYFVDARATGANDGTSWANAFTDLQSALAIPQGQTHEIWIAAGTYRPSATGDRSASFDLAGHTIYGGFDGTETSLQQRAGLFDRTILDGDLLGDDGPAFTNRGDNSRHVAILREGGVAVVDGMTIRGGHADGTQDGSGAGLWLKVLSYVIASELRFVDNDAAVWGGGLFLDGVQCTFTRCTFLDNLAGIEGGGVYTWPAYLAVYFDQCRFLGNQSTTGGGVGGKGGFFRSCAFSGNRARGGLGGGAIQAEYLLFVTNCTFYGNVATTTLAGGGAIHFTGYIPEALPVWNSIFWKNVDARGEGFESQISIGPHCQAVWLHHSCVPEFHPTERGPGNLRTDPELLDPLGPDGVAGTLDDDLRLRVGSPCIDRADDSVLGDLPPVDLAGRARAVDALSCGDAGLLDIGASESQVVQGSSNYCTAGASSLGVPAIAAGPCAWHLHDGNPVFSAGPVPQAGGFFFFGPSRGETPLGNGTLCIGGELHRTRFVLPHGGVLSTRLDVSNAEVAELLLPGTCWSFQAYYRDAAAGGAGFNFSDAVRVTFH